MEPVAEPRLPDRKARAVLLSGEYPVFAEKLNALGIETLLTGREERLPAPVAYHPDKPICPVSPTAQIVFRETRAGAVRNFRKGNRVGACIRLSRRYHLQRACFWG